jgi:protein associated with RNAse G/E
VFGAGRAFTQGSMTEFELELTVNAYDLGGNLKKSWKCRKLDSEGSTLILLGEFAEDVQHNELGLIRASTLSYEYFFPDRWYNIFRFEEPAGVLRNWYCNITMPPEISDHTIDYVDLDIDVLIWPDHSLKILDVEEYEENARKHDLSEDAREQVSLALTDVLAAFRDNRFPFNIGKH